MNTALRAGLTGLALVLVACGGDDTPAQPFASPGAGASPSASADADPEAAGTASPSPDPAGGQTYVVEPGDTLSEIASRFGTTVDALVEANDIADPDRIHPGQELRIP